MTARTGAVARVLAAAGLAAVALTIGPVTGTGVAASAASTYPGYDISWPQCPKSAGDGEAWPLPSQHARFMIVGLTDGTGQVENPCLASEWRYAKRHANRIGAYQFPTYPNRAEQRRARTGHFGTCTTLRCRLRNNGWTQARHAKASLRRVGGKPPMVWVDVEPRPQQPWTSSTAHNQVVIRSDIAALQGFGYRVGIYSTAALWQEIAGYRIHLPEWVPDPGTRTGGCNRRFSAGRVWISQNWTYPGDHGELDADTPCGRAPALSRMFART